MTLQLSPGASSLDRLETAIGRMVQKHGFLRVGRGDQAFSDALTALLLTEDPQRNPEVLDACVILPEALKPLGDVIARRVAGPDTAPALMQQYGIARAPAVVFLRDGEYLGALNGIRDWGEYQAELVRLLESPAQPISSRKAVGIPVVSETRSGACS